MTRRRNILLALAASFAAAMPLSSASAFTVSYLYNLSSTTAVMRGSMAPKLRYDPASKELYVSAEGMVRVFSPSGMEVYSFSDLCGENGAITGFTNGDFLALSTQGLVRCDYRGRFVAKAEVTGLPAGTLVSGNYLAYANGHVYLGNATAKSVLVLDEKLAFVRSFDLGAMIGSSPTDPASRGGSSEDDDEIRGLTVDQAGNILFTVPARFLAYIVSPDGQSRSFGRKGSSPGRFNVVGPIARDEHGFVYVADMLRSVVMVFDPNLKFVQEFGYRGNRAWNIATPSDLAVGDGKLFVSSMSARVGVVVFKVAN